ncbi:hypothetical protein Esti_006477 [Eimeria stiedai]
MSFLRGEFDTKTAATTAAAATAAAAGTVEVEGDRFLHHMVRYLVGSMVQVAVGEIPVLDFARLVGPPAARPADAAAVYDDEAAAAAAAAKAAGAASASAAGCLRCRGLQAEHILKAWASQQQQQQQQAQQLLLSGKKKLLLAPAGGLLLQQVLLLPGLEEVLFPSKQ